MILEELEQLLNGQHVDMIKPLDRNAMEQARYHWDHIAKPLDGMGRFEKMIIQIAGIQENYQVDICKKAVIPMCADNGIVAEGVSQSGMEVTAIVAANMAGGIANVCRMAHFAGAQVFPVDIGIASDDIVENLTNRKVRKATRDFLIEPAMTKQEVLQAILVGIEEVEHCKEKGYQLIATGEMGIGNTTTSSAMASVLLDMPVCQVTGRGAGLDDKGLLRKQQVIEQAIAKYNIPREDTLTVLQTLGGLDIAGLVGLYIGGAIYRIPVVIDGIIASVAALVAFRLIPQTLDFMMPSHASKEPATKAIMRELSLEPVIEAELALGEGTGAVMLFPLLDMALQIYHANTTFSDISIQDYERY